MDVDGSDGSVIVRTSSECSYSTWGKPTKSSFSTVSRPRYEAASSLMQVGTLSIETWHILLYICTSVSKPPFFFNSHLPGHEIAGNILHETESFLRSQRCFSWSRNSLRLWKLNVHYRVHNSHHQMNTFYNFRSYFLNIQFNIAL
jgi:hypothetical protein